MKKLIFFLAITCCGLAGIAQEFRFYLNGSPLKDAVCTNFEKGDLFRVVYINKNTSYQFKIVSVAITLTPMPVGDSGISLLNNVTRFIINNPSDKFSACPDFTIDLVSKLDFLKYHYSDITFQVTEVASNSARGRQWLLEHMPFGEMKVKKQSSK
jgi:hypothetical protein